MTDLSTARKLFSQSSWVNGTVTSLWETFTSALLTRPWNTDHHVYGLLSWHLVESTSLLISNILQCRTGLKNNSCSDVMALVISWKMCWEMNYIMYEVQWMLFVLESNTDILEQKKLFSLQLPSYLPQIKGCCYKINRVSNKIIHLIHFWNIILNVQWN